MKANELAVKCCISASYLSELESGKRANPAKLLIEKFAAELDVTVDWLLGRSDICTMLPNRQQIADLPQAGDAVDLPGVCKSYSDEIARLEADNREFAARVDALNLRISRLELLRDPAVQAAINAYVKDAMKDYFEEERLKMEKGKDAGGEGVEDGADAQGESGT
jgi:transcriptional regulator with XRE-family HTH domain